MEISAVTGTFPILTLPSLTGGQQPKPQKTATLADSSSGGHTSPGGGGKLFAALLTSLTQFVKHRAAAADSTPPTQNSGVLTDGTPTTGIPTTGTLTDGAPTLPVTAATSATRAAAPASTTVSQDLHAFLHNLSQALSANAAQPLAAQPPALNTPATPTAPIVGTESGQYARQSIIAELTSLIDNLSNSQVVSASSSAVGTLSNLSQSNLANLNSAFNKLIGDLGGNTPASRTTTTMPAATPIVGADGTTVSTAAAGTGSTATPGVARPETSLLQAFLTSFLQDLQRSTGNASTTLGNHVNATA